jgi:hypothetical protein
MPAEAKQPILDAAIEFDGVDFSNSSNEVNVEISSAEHDTTGFQGGGYSEETPGLKTASITIVVFQDYSAGGIHQTVKPVYDGALAVPVVIKPDDEEISATNPAMVMVSKLYKYNPIGAKVGEPQSMTLELKNGSRHGYKEFESKAELDAFLAEI